MLLLKPSRKNICFCKQKQSRRWATSIYIYYTGITPDYLLEKTWGMFCMVIYVVYGIYRCTRPTSEMQVKAKTNIIIRIQNEMIILSVMEWSAC